MADANWWLGPWRNFAWQPVAVVGWCLLAFIPLRACLGGANYLPSRAWYLLCFIIPAFVIAGLASSSFCVPLQPDLQTAFHVVVTLVYLQLDLFVASRLVGRKFGSYSLFGLAATKLSLDNSEDLDGLVVPGTPPIARSGFELNGALFHEIFWNVFVCQNCIDAGVPTALAICAVPATSCLVHGIVSNINTGLRCLPNFLWVALAYHASNSVAPPALIHAMWYFTDAKLCFALKTMKRDWDVKERRDEGGTPCWDQSCSVAVVLILTFYLSLNLLVYYQPSLRSTAPSGNAVEGGCGEGFDGAFFLEHPVELGLVVVGLIQLVVGAATWSVIRAGMDVLAENGDLTEAGIKVVASAVQDAAHGGGATSDSESNESGDGTEQNERRDAP